MIPGERFRHFFLLLPPKDAIRDTCNDSIFKYSDLSK